MTRPKAPNLDAVEPTRRSARGEPLPDAATDSKEAFHRILEDLWTIRHALRRLAKAPGGRCIGAQVETWLQNVQDAISTARPHGTCPYCRVRQGVAKGCEACEGSGWVTKSIFESAPKPLQKRR